MSSEGLSKARLGRLHDVMAGYVERGEMHEMIAAPSPPPPPPAAPFATVGAPKYHRARW
jgi:hypothetical protein